MEPVGIGSPFFCTSVALYLDFSLLLGRTYLKSIDGHTHPIWNHLSVGCHIHTCHLHKIFGAASSCT